MSMAEDRQHRLQAFIINADDTKRIEQWDMILPDPIENPEAVRFELFALRAFTADFIAYTLVPDPEQRSVLCKPIFEKVRAYADRAWEEGAQGLEQRFALYATALQQRPEQTDSAILTMFCKLCQRTDEPFLQKAPELLLDYVQDIRGILLPH